MNTPHNTTALPKVLESKARIRFQDCDPFNHLNNAAYINYLINAREDQLIKHYGLDIYKLARTQGKSWVVGSNQIAYLKPAFLMEPVTIDSQLFHYGANELHVELRMWNHDKTEIKAVMWSSFVHFSLVEQKRIDHEAELMQLFEAVCLPLNANSFQERAAYLKAKNI